MYYRLDGATRRPEAKDIKPGVILRMQREDDGIQFQAAFSDNVVLKVEGEMVKLARPYTYMTLADTTSPSVLTGVERYEASVEAVCAHYSLVLTSTGQAVQYRLKA